MTSKAVGVRVGIAAAVALLVSAQSASAQWSVSGVGVAEYDTNEALMLLAGVSAGPGGMGWSPVVGLQAQYLTYPIGDRNRSILSIRPSAGLRNGYNGGAYQARVGYAFRVSDSEDSDAGVPVGTLFEDSNDGVVLSVALDHWGTGGPLGFQVLGSYNLGGESLWTRGRVTTRVAQPDGGGQVRVGGEVAYMTSDNFSALQPGGVVEWHNGSGLILGLGAGVKIIDGADNATYVRAEVVLPLRR